MEPNTSMPAQTPQPKSNMMVWVVAIVLILVIGIGYTAMRNTNSGSTATPSPEPSMTPNIPMNTAGNEPTMSPGPTDMVSPSPTGSPTSETTGGAVHTVIVTGHNFSFAPSAITVKKGEKVKIVFQNSGGTHDWVIDEFNAHTTRIQGGQSATIEFTPDKVGTFEYYCSVGTHRQMGMKGNLVVQ